MGQSDESRADGGLGKNGPKLREIEWGKGQVDR